MNTINAELHDRKMCLDMRMHILETVYRNKAGHIGSALSMVEILYSYYRYFDRMKSLRHEIMDRPRLILSSGQGALALYSALYVLGYIRDPVYNRFMSPNSDMPIFPNKHASVLHDFTAGSLGHGLGVALGEAYYYRENGLKSSIYCIVGDGELNEGSIWEAALATSHFKLNNVVLIVNANGMQIGGTTRETMNLGCMVSKFEAFGWHAVSIDGHDPSELRQNMEPSDESKPVVVIANTIKGKGISFMENNTMWHARVPTRNEFETALAELRSPTYEYK